MSTLSNFKASALALAMVGAIAAVPAHAYVSASAVFEMSNLTFSQSGGSMLDASDFSFLTWISTAGMDGDLNGASFGPYSSSAANTDFAPACVGSGCAALALTNNSFAHIGNPPVGDYAAADQLETGTPISGISGLTTPATISQAAYAAFVTGTGLASANADNNLNSSYIFKLGKSMKVDIDFDLTAYLMVSVTDDEIFPGFATAQATQDFSIVDLTTGVEVYKWSVDLFGVGATKSLNAPLPMDITLAYNEKQGHFTDTTPLLQEGTLYQLSARSSVKADVGRARAQVPEPAVMGLLGIGLVGLGLARRNRRSA